MATATRAVEAALGATAVAAAGEAALAAVAAGCIVPSVTLLHVLMFRIVAIIIDG